MATADQSLFSGVPPQAVHLAFEAELAAFIDRHDVELLQIDNSLRLVTDAARQSVLAGGKRLRPTFAYWGWRCLLPSGAPGEPLLIRAAASLELLHACALVHDDVVDGSDTRRGQPAAHRQFAAGHRNAGWPGDADSFGAAGAILLGDLLLSWSEEMFAAAIRGLPEAPAVAATAQFDLMRTEVVAGQFLDVIAQARGDFDVAEARRVIEFKTSRYTVQRPLSLGAAAAGAGPELLTELARFGRALGEAFQLRDDLLGVFGDPALTGKPAGDDLREGKRTVLLALATHAADHSQRAVLQDGTGNPSLDAAGLDRLREVLVDTGARAEVERLIVESAESATEILRNADIRPDAAQALQELISAAAHRST
ncbi:MAG: polyprenyl synthetase family protein [Frankiales bacterium]|nr:polyprenyl synthetase family protein [Frankiales bacterium]